MTERAADIAHPTLAGHRLVAALWWPAAWLGDAARRREILAHWTVGATLHRFADGDLLTLAQPQPMDCERLRAWPLQRTAGALCSAALQPADLAGRPTADVWLAEGGRLRALLWSDAEAVDPADWITIDVPLLQPLDLALPEPPRQLVAEPKALQDILGPGIPTSPSPEAQRLLQALQHAGPGRRTTASHGAASTERAQTRQLLTQSALGLVLLVAGLLLFSGLEYLQPVSGLWMVVVASVLFGARRGWRQPSSTAAGKAGRAAAPALPARRPSARLLPQRWRNWAARMAMTTGLARLLGAQHAAYMRRMLAMFDEGRLDDALRHAVPLGADGQSLGQAFGHLGPRADLRLGDRGQASASVNFGPDLEQHLRGLYRRAAQQLETAGRLDEAVFVLAELLQARQEALDLLERHGRAADAAELALRWDMPAAQIVRLYAVAGDWRRAVLVARRDNAFAAAIDLLQSRWPQPAAQLRTEWAETLTARGCWLEAVRVLWPLSTERARGAPWLDVADASGGTTAARALAWRALGWPESLAAREALVEVLQTDTGLAAERQALVDELLRLPKPVSPAARQLATLMTGPALADAAGQHARDPMQLRALVELAGDAALSADLPPLNSGTLEVPRPLNQQPDVLVCDLPPAGLQAVLDGVPLPDGELLLALGEGGAVRLDARGRRLAHFAVPAHQLVLADDGGSALALARRDGVWRVSRLDLTSGRCADLGMHRLDAFACRFDGVGWSVGVDRRVDVLDVHSPQLRDVLWRAADLPGPVLQIDRCDTKEHWVLGATTPQGQTQQWIYLLDGRRLLSREEARPRGDETVLQRFLAPGHGLVDIVIDARTEAGLRLRLLKIAPNIEHGNTLVLDGFEVHHGAEDWLAVSRADENLELAHWQSGRVHARWQWPEADAPQLRFHRGCWLVFDARGRVAVLDTETGRQQRTST